LHINTIKRKIIKTQLDNFVEKNIRQGIFPGAVYLVSHGGKNYICEAKGWAVVKPTKIPMERDTIFDLASLTKPLITALLVGFLYHHGEIKLEDTIIRYLPEFKSKEKSAITITQLLTHSSGLPDWRPLYFFGNNINDYLKYLDSIELEYTPGTKVVYSCLGYIILGEIIKRITGKSLDKLAHDWITKPLNLKNTMFNPPQSFKKRIAATEEANQFERTKSASFAQDYTGWRQGVVWGEVLDQNCYSLGGVSGNAGLFSIAEDIFTLAQEFLGMGKLIPQKIHKLFFKNFTPSLEEHRSIGWQLASTPDSSAGPTLHPSSIGHDGFTGTSLWIDPVHKSILILLTNRHHPTYQDREFKSTRQHFHKLAMKHK